MEVMKFRLYEVWQVPSFFSQQNKTFQINVRYVLRPNRKYSSDLPTSIGVILQ